MNNKKIKWTILSVGIVICMALIFLISSQFKTQSVVDTKISPDRDISSDVAISSKTSEKDIIIKSEVSSELVSSQTSEVDSKNKQQAIQSDIQKPTYTQEQLTNPNQKPNGDKAAEEDKPTEGDKLEKPTPPTKNTSGGLPGFDNVPNGGENHGEHVDGEGDINKQIGNMGE